MKFVQINDVEFGQTFKIGGRKYVAYMNTIHGRIDIFKESLKGWELVPTSITIMETLLSEYFSPIEKGMMTVGGKNVFRCEEEFKVGDVIRAKTCGSRFTICIRQDSRSYALYCHNDSIVYDNNCGKPFNSIPDLLNYHLSGGYEKV